MIYIRIWEGLGNQLFQYAYAKALQLRNNQKVCLCVLPREDSRVFRRYQLDKFMITLPRNTKIEKVMKYITDHADLRVLIENTIFKYPILKLIQEKDVKYNEKLLYLKGNYFLDGWFQNEKYFKEYEDVIRKELRPRKKIKISSELKKILEQENTVSIHIRRGDFIRYNNLLSMDYYERACLLMNQKIDNAYYIIFSDDMNWVRTNMTLGEKVYFINEDGKREDYEELFIMSRCKHNIIANSTFSWWGAWLNTNENKIVIGPNRWFVRSTLNIMPEEWIKL